VVIATGLYLASPLIRAYLCCATALQRGNVRGFHGVCRSGSDANSSGAVLSTAQCDRPPYIATREPPSRLENLGQFVFATPICAENISNSEIPVFSRE
jgi:hypothetical protein